MRFHDTVYSQTAGADVDRKIVSLVDVINLLGHRTLFSCEGIAACTDFPEGSMAYIAVEGDVADLRQQIAAVVTLPYRAGLSCTPAVGTHWELHAPDPHCGRTYETTVLRFDSLVHVNTAASHLWRCYASAPGPVPIPAPRESSKTLPYREATA